MKKLISLIITVALSALSMASCAGNQTETSETTEEYKPEEMKESYNRENETCTILKRNEQIFSFFASFFLLLFRPLKHHFNAD